MSATATTQSVKLTTRSDTKEKYDAAAEKRRLTVVEMCDLAIDAWNSLTRKDQDALIERRHPAQNAA